MTADDRHGFTPNVVKSFGPEASCTRRLDRSPSVFSSCTSRRGWSWIGRGTKRAGPLHLGRPRGTPGRERDAQLKASDVVCLQRRRGTDLELTLPAVWISGEDPSPNGSSTTIHMSLTVRVSVTESGRVGCRRYAFSRKAIRRDRDSAEPRNGRIDSGLRRARARSLSHCLSVTTDQRVAARLSMATRPAAVFETGTW